MGQGLLGFLVNCCKYHQAKKVLNTSRIQQKDQKGCCRKCFIISPFPGQNWQEWQYQWDKKSQCCCVIGTGSVVVLCKSAVTMTFYFLGCISQIPNWLQSVITCQVCLYSRYSRGCLSFRGLSGTEPISEVEHVFKSFPKVCLSPELEQCNGNVSEKETTPCYLLLLDHSLFDLQVPVLFNGLLSKHAHGMSLMATEEQNTLALVIWGRGGWMESCAQEAACGSL